MSCTTLMLVCCLAFASARPQIEEVKADLLERIKNDLMQPQYQSNLEDKELPAHQHSNDESHKVAADLTTRLSEDKDHTEHDNNGGDDLNIRLNSQHHTEKAHQKDKKKDKSGSGSLEADHTTLQHLSGEKGHKDKEDKGLGTRIIGDTLQQHTEKAHQLQSEAVHVQQKSGDVVKTLHQELNREKRDAYVLPASTNALHGHVHNHPHNGHNNPHHGHNHPHHGHNHPHHGHNHHNGHSSSCDSKDPNRSCSGSKSHPWDHHHHGSNSGPDSSSDSDSDPCWDSGCRQGTCATCAIP